MKDNPMPNTLQEIEEKVESDFTQLFGPEIAATLSSALSSLIHQAFEAGVASGKNSN